MDEWHAILVEWINCLKLGIKPVENLAQLRSGEFFVSLRRAIAKSSEDDKDVLAFIFELLGSRYPNFVFKRKKGGGILDLSEGDLRDITSLLLHYLCAYMWGNDLAPPLCLSLMSPTNRLVVKNFLHKMTTDVTNQQLVKMIMEASQGDGKIESRRRLKQKIIEVLKYYERKIADEQLAAENEDFMTLQRQLAAIVGRLEAQGPNRGFVDPQKAEFEENLKKLKEQHEKDIENMKKETEDWKKSKEKYEKDMEKIIEEKEKVKKENKKLNVQVQTLQLETGVKQQIIASSSKLKRKYRKRAEEAKEEIENLKIQVRTVQLEKDVNVKELKENNKKNVEKMKGEKEEIEKENRKLKLRLQALQLEMDLKQQIIVSSEQNLGKLKEENGKRTEKVKEEIEKEIENLKIQVRSVELEKGVKVQELKENSKRDMEEIKRENEKLKVDARNLETKIENLRQQMQLVEKKHATIQIKAYSDGHEAEVRTASIENQNLDALLKLEKEKDRLGCAFRALTQKYAILKKDNDGLLQRTKELEEAKEKKEKQERCETLEGEVQGHLSTISRLEAVIIKDQETLAELRHKLKTVEDREGETLGEIGRFLTKNQASLEGAVDVRRLLFEFVEKMKRENEELRVKGEMVRKSKMLEVSVSREEKEKATKKFEGKIVVSRNTKKKEEEKEIVIKNAVLRKPEKEDKEKAELRRMCKRMRLNKEEGVVRRRTLRHLAPVKYKQ